MSNRTAEAEAEWRKSQFHLGYSDGRHGYVVLDGHPSSHYWRGFRAGAKRHQLESVLPRCRANKGEWPHVMQCTYLAKMSWHDEQFSGEWVPVCRMHGRVAERAGFSVRDGV